MYVKTIKTKHDGWHRAGEATLAHFNAALHIGVSAVRVRALPVLVVGVGRTENLGSDWAHTPSIVKVGDTDDDGTPNLVIAGKKGSSQVLGFMSIL